MDDGALTLQFSIHPAQTLIYNSQARFKVVAAGRRFGKTILAVIMCISEAMKDVNERGKLLGPDSEVVYIGVDREQAKRNAWHLFEEYTRPLGATVHKQLSVITMPNGVRIRMMGMDNPHAARGMKLRYAALDEYADMPDWVWGEIIRPALTDCEGGAIFIGTPRGKNHFYQLHLNALTNPIDEKTGFYPFQDYEAFNFAQKDNPTISEREQQSLASEYARGSEALYKQEIQAQFISKGGQLFSADDFLFSPEKPARSTCYVTADLAGFGTEPGKRLSDIKKMDDSAIVVNHVDEKGNWWVEKIDFGKWDVRETALRLVKAYYDNDALSIGIEKGISKNAVQHYLAEYSGRYNRWLNVIELTHGNRHKWDRIQWALQGRLQKKQITLNPGDWNDVLIDQAVDFPDRRTHDDLLDALAYQDQLVQPIFWDFTYDESQQGDDNYDPADPTSGY